MLYSEMFGKDGKRSDQVLLAKRLSVIPPHSTDQGEWSQQESTEVSLSHPKTTLASLKMLRGPNNKNACFLYLLVCVASELIPNKSTFQTVDTENFC